jgi:hypothetical protein
MNESAYLENELKFCSKYQLSDSDKSYLEKNSAADFIFKKITSNKFRKWSINDEQKKKIKDAVELKMKNNEPIEFVLPFGGYKLWRLPSSPEADWAEFFAINHYCQYLAPILSIYEPGVEFIFYSVDFIVERIDNIPRECLEKYFNSFSRLLKIFSEYFPDNFKMEIKRLSSLYEKENLERELSLHVKEVEKNFLNQRAERVESLLKSSRLNIKLNGQEDWTKLSQERIRDKIINGLVVHEAQHLLEKRKEFIDGRDKIRLSPDKASPGIPIGTTKSSVVKFWVGFGILEKNRDEFKDIILSPKQFYYWDNKKIITVKIDLAPLSGLNNFREIKVIS